MHITHSLRSMWIVPLLFGVAMHSHSIPFQMGFGVTGGLGYSAMGDFEEDKKTRERSSEVYYWDRLSYSVPHFGYGCGAEVRVNTPDRPWGALGIGYLRGRGSFEVLDTLDYDIPTKVYQLDQSVDVSVIPLTLTVGARFHTRFLSYYGGLGLGVYLGRFSIEKAEQFEEPGFWWTADFEANMSSIRPGLHVIGGTEIFATPQIAIYGEGLFRLAKLSEFRGSMKYSYRDSDGYSFATDENAYAIMNESPHPYHEEGYFSVEYEEPGTGERWMVVDFSGFFFQAGVRFYFQPGR